MSHQIFYFLLFYTSLYIITQQTSFFINFITSVSSLNIICKKDFRDDFSFFNGSTETLAPTHLTLTQPKSTTYDASFLSILP